MGGRIHCGGAHPGRAYAIGTILAAALIGACRTRPTERSGTGFARIDGSPMGVGADDAVDESPGASDAVRWLDDRGREIVSAFVPACLERRGDPLLHQCDPPRPLPRCAEPLMPWRGLSDEERARLVGQWVTLRGAVGAKVERTSILVRDFRPMQSVVTGVPIFLGEPAVDLGMECENSGYVCCDKPVDGRILGAHGRLTASKGHWLLANASLCELAAAPKPPPRPAPPYCPCPPSFDVALPIPDQRSVWGPGRSVTVCRNARCEMRVWSSDVQEDRLPPSIVSSRPDVLFGAPPDERPNQPGSKKRASFFITGVSRIGCARTGMLRVSAQLAPGEAPRDDDLWSVQVIPKRNAPPVLSWSEHVTYRHSPGGPDGTCATYVRGPTDCTEDVPLLQEPPLPIVPGCRPYCPPDGGRCRCK